MWALCFLFCAWSCVITVRTFDSQQAREHLHHTPDDAVWSWFAPHRPAEKNVTASCSHRGQPVSGGNTSQTWLFLSFVLYKTYACTNCYLSFLVLQFTICGRQGCSGSQTQTCTRWHPFTWLHPQATQRWSDICLETRYLLLPHRLRIHMQQCSLTLLWLQLLLVTFSSLFWFSNPALYQVF